MTHPIIEAILSQIVPAKAALADRWMKNAKHVIAKTIADADGPMVYQSGRAIYFNPHMQHRNKSGVLREQYVAYNQGLFTFFNKEKFSDAEAAARYDAGDYTDGRFAPKTEEELQKMASEYADSCWSDYLAKMARKFEKINASEVEIIGTDPLINELKVKANNGVEFTVCNSIVINCSPNGVWFNQFPTKFGRVTQNGVPVKNAASKKAVEDLTA